jgi:opacity protein-like surface antigen
MKKLLLLALVVLITVPAISQLKFGIKAGVSTTSLSMPTSKVTSGTSSVTVDAITNAKYGFHGGLFMRLTLLGVYIQPEVLLATRTNEYTVTNQTLQSTVTTIVKQNYNKLDIPVMVGFKLGPVRINAGPSASLLINSPKDLVNSPDFKSMYNNLTFGYQAGVGIDLLKKLTIDLRYEGSLKKYQNQIQNVTGGAKYTLDDRPNAFLLSVGLIF